MADLLLAQVKKLSIFGMLKTQTVHISLINFFPHSLYSLYSLVSLLIDFFFYFSALSGPNVV